MGTKKMYVKLDEAATMMSLSVEGVKDLIENKDLPAYGTKQDKLKTAEIHNFMGTPAKLLNLDKASIELDLPVEDVEDLIEKGDLPAYGIKKNIIKLCDINNQDEETPAKSSMDANDEPALEFIRIFSDDVTDGEAEALDSNYGEGSVYKNEKRGCWQAAFYIQMPDGSKKRKIVSGRSEIEVISKMQMVKGAAAGTASPSDLASLSLAYAALEPREKKTVKEVFDKFLASKSKCEKSTINSYYYAGKDIVKYLGEKYIHEVTVQDIEDFFEKKASERKDGKFSKSTLDIRRKTLSGMFKLASKYGYIIKGTSPMLEDIDMPEGKETDRDSRFLKPKQVSKVLNSLSEHAKYKTILEVLLATGLRIQELLPLRWDDIKVKVENGKEFYVLNIQRAVKLNKDFVPYDPEHPRYIIGEPKTKSSNREVPLPQRTLELLNEWKKTVQADDKLMKKIHANKTENLIFTNKYGKLINYNTFYFHFSKYLDAAYKRSVQGTTKQAPDKTKFPFDVGFHMFRHTYASLLLEEGVQMKVISEYLGHKTIDITSDIYTTVTDTVKQNTLPQIDNILDRCDIPE